MTQWIGYGQEKIPFEIPDGCTYFEIVPNKVKLSEDADKSIQHAINNPVGADLKLLVKEGTRICIISDDISRPTPVWRILNILLPKLHSLGARKQDISIVIALGSHRSMTQQEIDYKLGNGINKEYKVLQSTFNNEDDLVDMGKTESGVSLKVFKGVMDSDIRIGIGNIVPHGTLGWSGGSKILFPGVTAQSTVAQFHMKAAMLGNSNFGNAENPIRYDIEKWTEKIGLHFIINTILSNSGEICHVVAGHHVLAHRKGVEFGKEIYFAKAPHKVDIVIVDSHPSDGDFWQGTKGFYPSDILLKDGGTSILAAPCFEGEGPHSVYAQMIGDDEASKTLTNIYEGGHSDMDPLAVAVGAQLSRMRKRYDMYMYTRCLSDEVLKKAKIHRVDNIDQELSTLNQKYGGHASIAIVRCGAEVVPYLEDFESAPV